MCPSTMAPSTSTEDKAAAAAALKREIRLLEKGNAEIRKDIEAVKLQVSNEVMLRVMADKHCEQEQSTLSTLRKGLALAKKHINRHDNEIQSFEASIAASQSLMMEAANSMADASQEAAKSQQAASTSQRGSATSRSKVRGRSPGSPKKSQGAGFGGPASFGEVDPSAPDSSALDSLKDKLVVKDEKGGAPFAAPRNAPGNQAEAEMLGHIHSTNAGLASAVDSMSELTAGLSAAAAASKVVKNDGVTPIKDKHYCAVLATRPPHTDVKKYLF